MVSNVDQNIPQKIAAVRGELRERFTVRRLGIVGSCARGEDTPESDVDILVDLAEPTFATTWI